MSTSLRSTARSPVRPTASDSNLDAEWRAFARAINRLIKVDLSDYKPAQMRRRLQHLMERYATRDFVAYAKLLERDRDALAEFKNFFTINVSEFYRDRAKFEYLHHNVLPQLVEQNSRLTIWSAGCSYGAEPYTLAMLLHELAPKQFHRIVASDIDAQILARARSGADYTPQDLRNLPPDLREEYFQPSTSTATVASETYQIVPAVRRYLQFRQHDLLHDRYPQQNDLILCRNVVIYFTDEAKERIYRGFYDALRPGGILFIGATELLPRATDQGWRLLANSFYQRPPAEAGIR
ncbi:MAG: chemotaxis protein CheR [Dehalococcoidia bacterium]|nr:chemotaxis protein CheR [Dehalococcoidia bacterium]